MQAEKLLNLPAWQELSSSEDAERLLSRCYDFHDAFPRFAQLDSGTYVNRDLQAVECRTGVLLLRIQAQWKDMPAIELVFLGLEMLKFDVHRDRDGRLEYCGDKVRLVVGGWEVQAERLFYRLGTAHDLGDKPGPQQSFWEELFV